MSNLVIIAKITASDGKSEDAKKLLIGLIEPTLTQLVLFD